MNAAAAGPSERRVEGGSPPSPLFVLTLLLVLLGAAAGIAFLGLRVQRAEAGLLVEELFEPGVELPFGLTPTTGLTTALQQRAVRLTRPAGAAVPPDEPEEIVIQRYGGSVSIERLFDPAVMPPTEAARKVEEWRKDPTRDFEVTLARGETRFGRWRVDHVHARHHAKGGTFRDVVRVNISVGDVTQVLFAYWPTDSTLADPKALVPLLERMRFEALWEAHEQRRAAAAQTKRQ